MKKIFLQSQDILDNKLFSKMINGCLIEGVTKKVFKNRSDYASNHDFQPHNHKTPKCTQNNLSKIHTIWHLMNTFLKEAK